MRVSKPPQERRAELVAAARALFDEKGVENTRVSDIVKRVGVAQGVFYYYFASKAEMVDEVVRQVEGEVGTAVDEILQDGDADFYGKLGRLIELYLKLVDQFLGDDETSLGPLRSLAEEKGHMAGRATQLVTAGLHQLVQAGARGGQLQLAYPWETAQVLLYGLLALAEKQLPTRAQVYAVVEQGLGLPQGVLEKRRLKAG